MCLRLKWKMKSTYVSCPAYKNVNAKSIICFTAVVDDFFLRRHTFWIWNSWCFFSFLSTSNIHIPFYQVHQSHCICLSLTHPLAFAMYILLCWWWSLAEVMNKSFDNICDYFFIQFLWFPLQSIVVFSPSQFFSLLHEYTSEWEHIA